MNLSKKEWVLIEKEANQKNNLVSENIDQIAVNDFKFFYLDR